MNRPQFFNVTPPGFKDVPYVKPITYGENPVGVTLAPGQIYNDFVVQLDNDFDQIFRSLFWQGVQQGEAGSVQIQLRDAFGNYLTDGYVPIYLLCWGAGSTPPDGGSGRAKVFEPELYCPLGSILLIDFQNPDTAASSYALPGLFEFRGVKRMPLGACS